MARRSKRNEKGALERLRKKIYSHTSEPLQTHRSRLESRFPGERTQWKSEKEEPRRMPKKKPKSLSIRVFVASAVFFVIALGIAFIVFLSGANIVSTQNVEISVKGPVATPSGEEYSFQILIENRNNSALSSTDLIIEYPAGTYSAEDQTKTLNRTRKALGTIAPGEVVRESVKVLLFGQKGDTKDVSIELEYRVSDSNAIFVAEAKHPVDVSESPLSLRIETLNEVNAGQEIALSVNIQSNTRDVLEDITIAVDYPFGFSFLESSIQPAGSDNATWFLGDLAPGKEQVIEIRGILEGQDGEEKVFYVRSGIDAPGGSREIATVYGVSSKTVDIVKPFLGLELTIGGESREEYRIASEQVVEGLISWVNNIPVRLVNTKIVISFSGNALDEQSVTVSDGFYNSVDNSITWDPQSKRGLGELEPGEGASGRFSFASLPLIDQDGTIITDPVINIAVSAESERAGEGRVPDKIINSFSRTVKINSGVVLSQRASYSTGPFVNQGPMPPRAEQETMYTITWAVVNSSNNLSGTIVEASLPSYVRWTGNTLPRDETITFNSASRTVKWELGSVRSGTGIEVAPREVSFQVGLTPSISHIGNVPELLGTAEFVANDNFTDATLRTFARSITTRLTSDPAFRSGDEYVFEQEEDTNN